MTTSLRPQRRDRWLLLAAATSVALIAYSALALPPPLYVPVNLAVALALVAGAGRAGLGATDLGLQARQAPAGLRWGMAAAGLIAGGLALGVLIPVTRPLFDDARAAGIGGGLLAYRTLVRIPLGTVVLEELAFRGVLLGAWRRAVTDRVAALASSLAFGVWHVRPALDLLDANDLASGAPERVLALAGAVAGTTFAGLVFCWLRLRSKSLLAPALAHIASNSLAMVAAFVA